MVNIEAIIWYGAIFESVLANILVWIFPSFITRCKKKMPRLLKALPLTKAWAFIYLTFVIWVGSALFRSGVLPW